MSQSMRRAMIRLGLAEPEGHEEDYDRSPAPQRPERRSAPAQPREDRPSLDDGPRRASEDRGSDGRGEPADRGPRDGESASQRRGAEQPRTRPAREHRRDSEYRAPVTPIKRAPSTSREDADDMRTITTVHPRSYNDAKSVGESFRDGTPVIMDLSDLAEAEAKRLVDFAAGLVYALHGSIERVTAMVFLLTPSYVEVVDSSVGPDEDLDAAEA
ncbi:cell division protein SepF [Kocuria palustris]|uniref:cell division protein SepF n=1 Tax=Kocuria palustris TaxID=71999 RepID=UPI00077B7C54|nr:cell division protein SepF [Kocuria palustris]